MTLLDLYEDEPPRRPFNKIEFEAAVEEGGEELQRYIEGHTAEEGRKP